MLEDGGSRLLIGPSHLMTGAAELYRVRDKEQARWLLRYYINEDWEMSALRGLAAEHGIGQLQSVPDTNLLELMAGKVLSWPMIMAHVPQTIDLLSDPVTASVGQGSEDSLNPAIYLNLPVPEWTLAQRFHFVVGEAMQHVGPAIREELERRLTLEAILWAAVMMAAMAAATAAGIGAVVIAASAAATFAVLGWATPKFLGKLAEFLDNLFRA